MGVIYCSIEYLIPLLILIICYGGIARVLAQKINADNLDEITNQNTRINGENIKDNRLYNGMSGIYKAKRDKIYKRALKKTIRTLVLVGIGFVICWTTNEVMFLRSYFGFEINYNSTFYHFSVFMVFLHCTINPFIYLVKCPEYRQTVRDTYCCRKPENGYPDKIFYVARPETCTISSVSIEQVIE